MQLPYSSINTAILEMRKIHANVTLRKGIKMFQIAYVLRKGIKMFPIASKCFDIK